MPAASCQCSLWGFVGEYIIQTLEKRTWLTKRTKRKYSPVELSVDMDPGENTRNEMVVVLMQLCHSPVPVMISILVFMQVQLPEQQKRTLPGAGPVMQSTRRHEVWLMPRLSHARNLEFPGFLNVRNHDESGVFGTDRSAEYRISVFGRDRMHALGSPWTDGMNRVSR